MPCSGPRILPGARSRSRSSASLSASRLTVIAACSLSSYIAMRVRYCGTSSRDVTRCCSMRRAHLGDRRLDDGERPAVRAGGPAAPAPDGNQGWKQPEQADASSSSPIGRRPRKSSTF